MKNVPLFTAMAATALIGGAAFAQQPSPSTATTAAPPPAAETGTPTSTSVTTSDNSGATMTVTTTTNGPVPDTPANRAKYGGPMSNAGKRTAAKGN